MSAPVGPFNPTNELVAVAWLGASVPGIAAGQVATALPKDVTAWADQGFVQVTAIAGRAPNIDVPLRHPVFQLDFWANTPNSLKPPWNLANRLAELVRVATEAWPNYGKTVTVKDGYLPARIQAVYLISEPSRVPDDPSGFARYTADLAIDWVPA